MPFLEKSRKKKISAKDIYLHYLKENKNDKRKSQTIYIFQNIYKIITKSSNMDLIKFTGITHLSWAELMKSKKIVLSHIKKTSIYTRLSEHSFEIIEKKGVVY